MQRRSFLQKSTLGAASITASVALGKLAVARQVAPSERVRVGFVGAGGRAANLIDCFAAQPDVEVVGLAEIDPSRVPNAVRLIEKHKGKVPAVHVDFRHLIDDPSIDILVVGTPDHWHAIPTILACQAGKDVYVEKPDGHNLLEGQRMVAAMRKHQRIVQMGTQTRSDPGFLEAMEYLRSGKLGQVLFAKSWESTLQSSIGRPADSEPPPGVDYDLWLGPAPKRQFNPRRFHSNWRWFFDYGTGDLGNDGVHRIDNARYALAMVREARGEPPLGLPTKISAMGGKWYFDDMQEWPDTLQATYEYPATDGSPGLVQTYEMRVWTPYNYQSEGEGVALYGDQGYIVIGTRRWRAYAHKNELVAEGVGAIDTTPHVRNFLDSVKSRKRPNADLETVGHPASVMCHAANVAWRLGRQLQFDSSTETFVNDDEANALRTRTVYRKPWTLPEV
ncbi:MAG: Gfo/Idh/MocA family oxidoreductase [Planctomycetales bacterium]|nr:Gfo/Idh/MocA family oxidoreductase [Planctomycetales bacterium]